MLPPATARRTRRASRARLSVAGVLVAGVVLAIAVAVLPRHHGGHAGRRAGPRDATVALASSLAREMARPWIARQRPNGHFTPGVGGGSRYGDAMLGYALLQEGLRSHNRVLVRAGLRAIGYSAVRAHVHNQLGGSASVFEGFAFASAYNLARAHLRGDPEFARIAPAWRRALREITMVRLPATNYYGNHWLVEAVTVEELLRTHVHSPLPHAVLGGWRPLARTLSAQLVNERIPAMERRLGVRVRHRRAFLLSDPPDNPLAYQGLSFGLYARAVRLLGRRAKPAARRTLLDVANASLWLTAPDGDVGYFGRNQEEAWSLAGTAYGASVAATTPGVGPARAASLRELARRTLVRLRDVHGVSPRYGLNITPAVAADPSAGARGVDKGAGGAPFAALSLALVDWTVHPLAAGRPARAPLPLDSNGGAVLARGESQFAVVRHGPVWFAVRGSPSGKHPYDLRDDFGLASVKVRGAGGRWSDLMPQRPITLGNPDSAGPVLVAGAARGFPFGDRVSVSRSGAVTVRGGYRSAPSPFKRFVAHLANDVWVDALDYRPGTLLRSGTTFRFQPLACRGVRTSFTTRAGDAYDYSQFFRTPPREGGGSLADAGSRLRSSAPLRASIQDGYASGLDPHLWRARLHPTSPAGRPISFSLCATSSSSPSRSSSSP